MIGEVLADAFFAAIAGIGFGAISNPPKRMLVFAGLFAAIGHALRYYLMNGAGFDITSATLVGAFTIGLLGFVAGRISGYPAEIFSFPALLPMIPGLLAYKTILGLIEFLRPHDDALSASIIADIFKNGLTASFVLLAIVIGASMSVFIDTLSTKIETRRLLENKFGQSRK